MTWIWYTCIMIRKENIMTSSNDNQQICGDPHKKRKISAHATKDLRTSSGIGFPSNMIHSGIRVKSSIHRTRKCRWSAWKRLEMVRVLSGRCMMMSTGIQRRMFCAGFNHQCPCQIGGFGCVKVTWNPFRWTYLNRPNSWLRMAISLPFVTNLILYVEKVLLF